MNACVRVRVIAALAAALLAGCAAIDPYYAAPIAERLTRADALGDCARRLRDIDARIDALGVRDAIAPRVPGFPYLRVDRYTASLASSAPAAPWTERLSELDREARLVEFANSGLSDADWAALEACRPHFTAADRDRFEAVRQAAVVPDDYSTGLRALGLYPLTRLAFAAGIRGLHERTRRAFETPLEALPRAGELLRYVPMAPRDTASLGGVAALPLEESTAGPSDEKPGSPPADALGVPRLSRALGWQLLAQHAPSLVVDTASDDDRLGSLLWRTVADTARVAVDTGAPAAYARIAYARLGGAVRVQLVYTFWFPARPPEGSFDVLAGPLDGVVWRVTLGRPAEGDYVPLLYDTIHPCGCYPMFFPTLRVQARPQPDTLDEGMFAPQVAPEPADGERIVLRVASRTHYLQRVTAEPGAAQGLPYALRDDDELRLLPLPASREHVPGQVGTRSIFGPDGLVVGSERAERFYFWPMGIASAGQMRQWGRHATAFVGRRHFDDPLLLDRYFVIRDPRISDPR